MIAKGFIEVETAAQESSETWALSKPQTHSRNGIKQTTTATQNRSMEQEGGVER
jgi:hypothetical protein